MSHTLRLSDVVLRRQARIAVSDLCFPVSGPYTDRLLRRLRVILCIIKYVRSTPSVLLVLDVSMISHNDEAFISLTTVLSEHASGGCIPHECHKRTLQHPLPKEWDVSPPKRGRAAFNYNHGHERLPQHPLQRSSPLRLPQRPSSARPTLVSRGG